ncbi:MAG: RrF2 family transcriptional regulator [Capsulimonadaceae bacterium]
MLSQTAEYALRAIVFMAEFANRPYTIQQIAGPTQVPAGYLAKVLQVLARHGLVVSQRGLGGGFVLARPPEEITIYAVVQAVDPIRRIARCPLNNPDHIKLCPLHRRLDDATSVVEESLRSTTVAELVASSPIFRSATPDAAAA